MARRSFPFAFTGGTQTVTVSADYDGGFQFDVAGGGGSSAGTRNGGLGPQAAGGKGSRVTGTASPSVGDVITVTVGGGGGISAGGFGFHSGAAGGAVTSSGAQSAAGGGGGGSSAVVDTTTAATLAEAGGGGGGGGAAFSSGGTGGAGGYGGSVPLAGAAGAGTVHGSGGATSGTGGAAGTGGTAGSNASAGVGGAGGHGNAGSPDGAGGGGGGGGSTGGGGGGGGGSNGAAGGGAGGTSTAVTGSTFFNNYQAGAGQATVSWLVAPIATPSAPTGTITVTSTPTMTAAYSSVDGLAQQSYQIAVYATPGGGFPAGFDPSTGHYPGDGGTPLTAIWNSGVVFSSGPGVSVTPGKTIPNGNMTAFFQFTDAAGADSIGSAWATSAWVQATPGPTAPTLTVVPTPATARTTLTVTQVSPPASGTLGLTYYHIQRSLDGVDWSEILNGSVVSTPGNMLSPEDASFEGTIGNMSWARTGGAGAGAYSAVQAREATHSLSEAANAAAWQLTSQQYAVVGGAQYAAMLGVRASSTTTTVAFVLNWYDASGALISSATVQSGSVVSTAWSVLQGVVFAPANAAFVTLEAAVSASGGALFFDGNGLWQAAAVPAWSIGGGSVSFQDRAAPREQTIFYQVQGIFAAGGNVLQGSFSAAAKTYLYHDGFDWLFSATNPALDGVVNYTGPNIGSTSHEDQQAYYPEGRADPVIFHGTIHDDQFVPGVGSTMFTFQFNNDAQWATFTAIRALQQPCLLKTVYGDTAGAVQFWMVIGPDVATTLYGGGTHQAAGSGRGPQIRTVMCSAYVCAEPTNL